MEMDPWMVRYADLIFSAVLGLMAALWVLFDSRGRNMSGGARFLWALLTSAILIVGLPLYLIFRNKRTNATNE
jgi:hypothetical protein